MAEISYQQLASHLKEPRHPRAAAPPVYLIHGEDLLVASVFDEILRRFLPAPQDSLNYEPFDGASADIGDVLAAVNTFSLMPGTKVVALKDARIFHTKEDAARLLEQARTGPRRWRHGQGRALLSRRPGPAGSDLADMGGPGRRDSLPAGFDPGEDEGWIDALLAQCAANQRRCRRRQTRPACWSGPSRKAFPGGTTCSSPPTRSTAAAACTRAVGGDGMIIDCSVPKGERKADRDVQDAVLAEHMQTILAPRRKSMNRSAFQALCEMTGFNLGTFSHNLEILADYVGGRADITAEDVQAVLTRSKKDPIYEFTNAVTDRDRDRAFFFLRSLLDGGMHALQALSAIVNQVRKLLVAKGFTESASGAAWHRGCSFPQFQKSVMPAVVQHDRELLALLEDVGKRPWPNRRSRVRKRRRLKPKWPPTWCSPRTRPTRFRCISSSRNPTVSRGRNCCGRSSC